MYFLNYLDRNALPQARLNNLEEDLNLTGVEYNTAISILFVGYILMQGMYDDMLASANTSDTISSAQQHVPHKNQASNLPLGLHDGLGDSFSMHCIGSELCRSRCLPFLSR